MRDAANLFAINSGYAVAVLLLAIGCGEYGPKVMKWLKKVANTSNGARP